MIVQHEGYVLPVTKALTTILQQVIDPSNSDTHSGIVLNFRDPCYSAEHGGYHPVEMALNERGKILYITDFCYAGQPPFHELVKELDFDLHMQCFQHMGRDYPIAAGVDMYRLWESNFRSYFAAGVYQPKVSAL